MKKPVFTAAAIAALVLTVSLSADKPNSQGQNMRRLNPKILPVCAYVPQPQQTAAVIPQAPKFQAYDIPIDSDIQEYIHTLCEQRGLDFEMVLALIEVESDYNSNCVSSTNDYGLMQINATNTDWLSKSIGVSNLLDPRQNVDAGTYMLAQLQAKYGSQDKILMAYHSGESGARRQWNRGITQTRYTRAVEAAEDKLKEES